MRRETLVPPHQPFTFGWAILGFLSLDSHSVGSPKVRSQDVAEAALGHISGNIRSASEMQVKLLQETHRHRTPRPTFPSLDFAKSGNLEWFQGWEDNM